MSRMLFPTPLIMGGFSRAIRVTLLVLIMSAVFYFIVPQFTTYSTSRSDYEKKIKTLGDYSIMGFISHTWVEKKPQKLPPPIVAKCQFPLQDPFDMEIMNRLTTHPDTVECMYGAPSLVYLKGNLLKLNTTKANLLNIVVDRCQYMTLTLQPGSDSKILRSSWSKSFTREITIGSHHENIVVYCYQEFYIVGQSYLTRIVEKSLIEEDCQKNYKRHVEMNSSRETLSVLLVGVDGISRQNLIRSMPQTRNFLLNQMKALELYKFNKIEDSTQPIVLPLLAGLSEAEFKRRGLNFRTNLDKVDHLFLWHSYKQAGYRTAIVLDDAWSNSLPQTKTRWSYAPFDYYHRAMIVALEDGSDCIGDIPEVSFLLDYWQQLATVFNNSKNKPYFAYSFNQRLTHDDGDRAISVDRLYLDFFRTLKERNVLNNTVVVFFSDCGARFGEARATIPGMLESNTPFLFFMFPSWFAMKYPRLMSTFRTNQHRLTTMFDVHATFMDLLYFEGRLQKGSLKSNGISLLKEIPAERLCRHAGIPKKFCMCLHQRHTHSPFELWEKMADVTKNFIIDKTSRYRDRCEVFEYVETDSVLPMWNDSTVSTYFYYKITVFVAPGGRIFEAFVEYNAEAYQIKIIGEPLLLTSYGEESDCVQNTKLKKYCFCKQFLQDKANGLQNSEVQSTIP